jgi:hypothetical protein
MILFGNIINLVFEIAGVGQFVLEINEISK